MRDKAKFILIFLLLISLTSALDDLGTFKQNDCVRIVQTCASCSYVNISSVSYPNSSVQDANKEMTAAGSGEWYYDYCNTSVIGRYDVRGIGDLDGTNTNFATYFIITPNGSSLSTSSAITYGLILLVMFSVTIFFLIFSKTTEAPGVKLFFNMIGYITMFLTVGAAYILMQSTGVSPMGDTVEMMLFVLGIVLVIIMFYIFINQTRHVLALMKAKKGFGDIDNPEIF